MSDIETEPSLPLTVGVPESLVKKRPGRPTGSFKKEKMPLLNAQQVCDIISACHRLNVLKIEFGDLKVEFRSQVPMNESVASPAPRSELVADQNARVMERSLEELELLAVEDPVEYERVMMGKGVPLDEGSGS